MKSPSNRSVMRIVRLYTENGEIFLFNSALCVVTMKVRFIMKKMIVMITAITVGTGAAVLFLSRSADRRKRNRPMTFRELYEDNLCSDDGLFD